LDLGCGPGFYCAEFATLGHVCQGIDFSPASIDYARRHAPPNCTYTLQDLRSAPFGTGYDLVLFIFGEFNVFTAQDAQAILHKAHAALRPGASLLLEISTLDAVEQLGNQPSTWYSSPGGLFSERPHLCLMESFWEDASQTATERYLVIDAETAEVTRYASSTRGYDEGSILPMLAEAGFGSVEFFPSLTGKTSQEVDEFLVVHAKA
jgi:SAM-dependent methyltransferase